MPWIVAGGLVVSGLLGADASSNAADAQVAASAEQARVQREMFNKQLEVQQPYRAAGYDALNELRSMMSGRYTAYDENGMPVGVGGGTNVNRMDQGGGGGRRFVPTVRYEGGARGGGYAPAGTGARATVGDAAADAWVANKRKELLIQRAKERGGSARASREDIQNLYNEYYNGTDGGGGYQSGQPTGDMLAGSPEDLTGSGYLTKRFNAEDFYNNIDPGYAFRVKEGVRALDRSAAARGGLLGGNQLRGLTELGQNLGSQEYNNAYNRFQTERSNIFNNLAGIAGIGQTSANTVSNAAGNLGNVLGEGAIGAGNARASGYIGGANAISNAIGQGVNYYSQNQMLNRNMPNYAGSASTNRFIP
jgi:hypothetical protein